MTNDLSIALETLRLDPEDASAREALSGIGASESASAAAEELAKTLAAERAFHAAANHPGLCLYLVDAELGLARAPAEHVQLLLEKARLCWGDLWQFEAARDALKEALQIEPEHAEAQALQGELDAEGAAWQEQAEALSEKAAAAGDGPEAASLFVAEAELLLRHRNVTAEAEALLRRGLELDPHNRRADRALERVLAAAGRHPELAEHLARRIANATTPEEKAAAEVEAGRLAEKIGQPAEAQEHYRRALAACPADERAQRALEKSLAGADVDTLVKTYEAALKAAKRGPAEVAPALALGEIYWKRLSKMEEAEQCFRRVRKVQPFHPLVIDFYRAYYLAKDDIQQLLALLGQAQKNETDPEARIRFGIEMATAAERRPQLVEKAIDAWKLLVRIRPGLPEAVTALRRLYTKAEKWNQLLELLKEQCESLPASDVDGKVGCYLDMVPIYRDRLKLETMVINTYAAILALRPDHQEALLALAERYEAQSRWGDLAGVLARQAQATADVAQRVALYHRIAALWIEKFGNHHNAIAALERILEADPQDHKARTTLREIYTRGRSWRALLDLLRRELPYLAAGARRDHLAEMAVLAAERLADLRQAIGLWNEVLEIVPGDRGATTALVGLYEREKRWPALTEILGRLAESTGGEGSTEGCALLEKRGLILLEKLGAGRAALDTLRRVHAAQPENPRVLRALREAYSQVGDIDSLEAIYASRNAWDDLCDVLSGLAERTPDMRLRVRAFERVADIARNRLGQNERVIKAYEGILATEPENRAVARQAAEIYEKTERWGRLVATFEIILGPESAPALSADESLPILARARAVCEHKLQAKALAFKWCARAYRLAPTDLEVRAELERLGGEAEEWEMLLALFIERQGMGDRQGPDPEERLYLLRRCLDLLVSHVDRPTDLQRFAETILAEVPGDPEAELALIKLFTEKERWAELVQLQQVRQRRMTDPLLRAEALLRIARLEEDKLGDRKAATRSLQEAVEVEPENLRALRELARLLEAQQDFRSLAIVLMRQASLGDEAARAAALVHLGQVCEQELGEHKQATQAFLQALELDNIASGAVEGLERMFAAGAICEDDVAAVASRLAPYYELTENYAKWADALESLARVAKDDGQRKAHLEMLADLYAGPLGDSVAAYGAVRRIFELEPGNLAVRERLVQLAELVGKLPEIAESARRVLEITEEPGLRQELFMLVADVEERQPERLSDAEAALREVLKIDPLHMGAYRTLCRICKDAERWGALRDTIAARERHLPDVRQRIELLWQIIEIDEGLLYDREHATAVLGKIIELDRNDLKAYRILERHYAEAGKWRELDNLLVTETALVPRGDVADIKARRADLALSHFDAAAGALHLVAEILDLVPAHGQAVPLLERMLAAKAERPRAAEMLDGLYRASGNWQRLVEILDIEKETATEAGVIRLLERKAELQEDKLSSSAQALDTWRAVLDLDPHAERALAEAERLGGSLGRYGDLIVLYQTLADKRDPSDVAGIADLLSRAARLSMAYLVDRQAAIAAWRRVLDLDPGNAQTGGPAAEALESLYTDAGDIAGLVHVLRTRAEWPGDADERGRLLLRVADLQENRLEDLDAAVATYRGLLDGEGEAVTRAFENLDRIFQRTKQTRERVELLKRWLDHLDLPARRNMRFLISGLAEKELGDLDEAVSTVRPILDEMPEDREALATLVRLYQAQALPAEHLEILERLLALAGNDGERIDLLRQIAGLLKGPLGRAAEALDRWREILRLQPRDEAAQAEVDALLGAEDVSLRFAAAETLEPIYAKAGEHAKLAAILRVQISLAEDGHSRVGYRTRLAGIEESQLKDKKAAFVTWAAAIKDATSDPELDRLLDAYERVAAALGEDTILDIIDLYRAIEPDILAETIRMRVQQTVAKLAIKLGDLSLATDYYSRIVERRPDDDHALEALERIYEQQGDDEHLFDVLLRRAELAGSEKAELALRRRAALLARKLGRHEEAIIAWERVWSIQSTNGEAVAALEDLYTELGRWEDLAGLLERRLEQGVSAGMAIDLRFRLAEIHLQQLANRYRALEYLGAVLAGEPEHAGTIAILEGMLSDPEVAVEAANLLEAVYIKRNAWKDLVGIDSLRLKFSEDPTLRLAWTQRIAQVYEEQIEDLDEAFNWYGRVFQERPTDPEAQEQLVRLAPKQNRWRDLGRLLDQYLDEEAGNSDEVLAVVRIAIRVYDQELGDHDNARRYYRRYLEALPGERAASEIYEEALTRWEAWRELRDLLDEQSRIVEAVPQKVALLHRSAHLSDEKLGEPLAAIDALRTILDLDPSDARAAAALADLLEREARWDDLRDHLVWMIASAEDAHGKDELTIRLARVEAEHLGNAATAVDHYGEVLLRTPGNVEAVAALEALLTESELRPRVAELLEPALRTIRDLRRLADILEIRLESVEDTERRIEALREIATLEMHLGRQRESLAARGRAWLEDVTNAETLVEVDSQAAGLGEFEAFVGILDKGIALAVDPDLSADLCAHKANILDARIKDPERAIEAWRAALASRPDYEDAFVALERLLEDAGRTVELCETLEKHAEAVVEAPRREALIRRVAGLCEAPLADLPKAITAWRAVLELDQMNVEALDALARLYAATEDWQNLVETLQHKIESSTDARLLRALHFQAAELLDEKLGQLSDAAEHLRQIIDVAPEDMDALDMLASVYLREKRHAELVDVLDRRARLTGTGVERDTLLYQAAHVTEHELLDPRDAITRYRGILDGNPSHGESRAALWALARGEDCRLPALEALEPLLRLGQEWQALRECLSLRLSVLDLPAERLEVLADLAQVEEVALGDRAAAFATWARALAEDSTSAEAMTALERLAGETGNFVGLAEVYEERLKSVYDSELQVKLGSRLADLYEHTLAKPERAVELWREVETLPGGESLALSRQEVILRQLGRHQELADVLAREAEVATQPAQQADFWAALGELRLGLLGERDGAISAFRSALDAVPKHAQAVTALRTLALGPEPPVEALDILEPLAEEESDFVGLVTLLEARLAILEDASDRAALLRRIAEICESKLADLPRTLEVLGRALVAEPSSHETVTNLERVAEAGGALALAAQHIEAVLDAVEPMMFAEMAMRAARLRLQSAEPASEEAALQLYARVLEADSENVAALEALDGLYRRRGDPLRLAEILERRGALELDPARRLALYGEAAGLHEGSGNLAAAIAAWRLGREGDETDQTAIDELARLYEAAGEREEQVQILREKARMLDDGQQRCAVLMQVVAITAGPLGDVDGAVNAIKEALDADSDNPEALEALVELEERRGDFAALEEALLRQASALTGAAQLAVLAKLAGNAAEHLNDGDRALVYLQQILAADPQNAAAFAETERLLTSLERWHELIEMLERRADAEAERGNREEELACRVKVAAIWGEKLGAEDSALEALGAVLARDPQHFPSLLAVARIHESQERWPEASEALAKASDAAATVQEKADVFCRRAAVAAATGGSPEDVAALYRLALANDPVWLPAVVALEALARKTGDHAQLVVQLLARLALEKDPAKRKSILSEVASLYLGPLGKPGEAVAPLEQLVKLCPGDLAVQENLGRALIASGRVDEGEVVLGQLVEQMGKARRQKDVARVQGMLGGFAEERGDLAAAKQWYVAAYQIDPTQARVLGALARLSLRQSDAESARRYLRTLLLQSFDEKAAGITKAEVYLALGNLHREAGENAKARNMFERGLETDPRNEALKQALASTPK
ncbi:MAG: tetratricopeptide repeat protein [Deltaproteobacteria bacterium]|nr:tetratricopeptide repeat protein [Deltaproteobacteria bacterium]